jgi:hypothetical protein
MSIESIQANTFFFLGKLSSLMILLRAWLYSLVVGNLLLLSKVRVVGLDVYDLMWGRTLVGLSLAVGLMFSG